MERVKHHAGKEAEGGLQNHVPRGHETNQGQSTTTIQNGGYYHDYMEGTAIVHSVGNNVIIKVTWPKHHSVPPAVIYTLPIEDV